MAFTNNISNINIPVLTNDSNFNINWSPRILFSNVIDVSLFVYGMDNSFVDSSTINKLTTLSTLSTNDIFNPNTLNLLFESKYSYIDSEYNNNNTIYNKFYKEELESLIQDESYIIKCEVLLSEDDILNLDFSKPIYIEDKKIGNAYYKINSIKYKSNSLSDVELLKMNFYDNDYEITIQNNLITKLPSSTTATGTSSSGSSSGGGGTTYTLPTATASVLGGIKIGNGLNIDTGVVSVGTGEYIDGSLNAKLNLIGGTITGNLTLSQGNLSIDVGQLYTEDASINNNLWIGGSFILPQIDIQGAGPVTGVIDTDDANEFRIVAESGILSLDGQGGVMVDSDFTAASDVSIVGNLYVGGTKVIGGGLEQVMNTSIGYLDSSIKQIYPLTFKMNSSIGNMNSNINDLNTNMIRWANDSIPTEGEITYSSGDGSIATYSGFSIDTVGNIFILKDLSINGLITSPTLNSFNASIGLITTYTNAMNSSLGIIIPFTYAMNSSLGIVIPFTYAMNTSIGTLYNSSGLIDISSLTIRNIFIQGDGAVQGTINTDNNLDFQISAADGNLSLNAQGEIILEQNVSAESDVSIAGNLFVGGVQVTGSNDVTKAYVDGSLNLKAPLANPHFTGSAGFGTASPGKIIEAYGAEPAIRLKDNTGDNYFDILVTADDANLIFNSNNRTAILFLENADGYVAIGKGGIWPTYPLDVSGNIFTNGTLTSKGLVIQGSGTAQGQITTDNAFDLEITVADGNIVLKPQGYTSVESDFNCTEDVSVEGSLYVGGVKITGSGDVTKAYVDGSLATKANLSITNASIGLLNTQVQALNSSIGNLYNSSGLIDISSLTVRNIYIQGDGAVQGTINTDNNLNLEITAADGNLILKPQGYTKVESDFNCTDDVSIAGSLYVGGIKINNISDTSIGNWNTAYTHSQDNTQAHSDYLINNGNDTTSGSLTATNFILSSDERLKTNIQSLRVKPKYIKYKQFNLKSEPEQLRYGVLAQDLANTHPELIRRDEKGIMSVAYIDLLVMEINDLKVRVAELERRIDNVDSTRY